MKSVKDIISHYNKAKGRKGVWDNRYEEVFKYVMPDRDNFYNPNNTEENYSRGEDKRHHLFTSTGEQAADSFVNRVQAILTPIAKDWVGIEVGDLFENADEMNRNLEKMADLINGHKGASNFDTAITEFYYDLLAGTACLLITEGTRREPLNFKAVPLNELVIDEGLNGKIDYVWREFKMRKEIIKHQWAELEDMEITEDDMKCGKEITILECVYPNYDKGTYIYKVINKEKESTLVEREYQTNPFIVLRWSKGSGEVYGRGLGMKALHDIQSLNKIMEYSLRALAFTIPTLLAQQDATFDPDDFVLEPGVMNVVPSTATSNPSIVPLQIQPNHDVTAYNIESLKMDIKRSMLDNQLPSDGGTPKTATEIAQRMKELNVNISSVFGRLVGEFLFPCVRRMIEVLQSFEYIDKEFNINQIDGYGMKIKIETPLATQHAQGEVQNIVGAASLLASFDPSGQMIGTTLKLGELMPYLLKSIGVPSRFVNSKEEVAAVQQQMAEMMAAQQQAEMSGEVAKETAIAEGKENAKRT